MTVETRCSLQQREARGAGGYDVDLGRQERMPGLRLVGDPELRRLVVHGLSVRLLEGRRPHSPHEHEEHGERE